MSEAPEESLIPEEFIVQVKEALENLYDFPALQRHPLIERLPLGNSREAPAHQLRRELIEAVERLKPINEIAVRSGAGRIYNLVHLHYVGGMTLQEAALELGISVRQAYRDLRRGQENVSSVLWFKMQASEKAAPQPETLSSIKSEVTQVEGNIKLVDMSALLQTAYQAVQRLAEQREIHLLLAEQAPMMLSTNPTLARQVLTNILSQAIQNTVGDTVAVHLLDNAYHPELQIRCALDADTPSLITPVIEHFLQQLRWQIQKNQDEVLIKMGASETTILIIDDNKGLVDLLKHYLTTQAYQVLAAYSGEDGLQLAHERLPDMLIMDLMMPGMDGWELLQRIRTSLTTRAIPVIICSVINDPELAYSLGASKFITKPVDKEKLLAAVQELES